ncbi:MAG TPA: LytTR family DNA-binding domain-containing protein [Flavisolibacter sp.]
MNPLLNCMIVEDEPLAQQVLEKYIADHPSLHLGAVCGDALQAQQQLASSTFDLVFLDINLPRISGINFLKTLQSRPAVIITTAYPEYAVEGFELDAADYLVKPFSFERFLKAVNKVLAQKKTAAAPENDSIFIKADKKVFRIVTEEILDLEASGDYVKIRTLKGQHLVNSTLKDLLDELPAGKFIRVHKSFAIAKNKITFIEGNYIRIGDRDIPVGATYREEVAALFLKK